jgi:hypothetical protein
MRLLVGGLLLASSIALAADRATLNVPGAYDTWVLTGTCFAADDLYAVTKALPANVTDTQRDEVWDGVRKIDPGSSWPEYGGGAVVEVLERQRNCARVKIVKTGESGYVAASLLGSLAKPMSTEARKAGEAEKAAAEKDHEDIRRFTETMPANKASESASSLSSVFTPALAASAFRGFWGVTTLVVFVGAGIVLYFLPAILAAKFRNAGAIFALDLLLGWTLIGWVVALVWAVKVRGDAKGVPPRECPACAELIPVKATRCQHCGTQLFSPPLSASDVIL